MQIKDKVLDVPVIQGGMGVGVSLSSLAGAVAANGACGVAFSEVVVKQTADVEEYFKNLIRFEGYKVIPEEYDESDMLMHYDELSIQANKLLFLESREE